MALAGYVREHPWTWAVLAGCSCGILGLAGGRWLAPTRVEEREVVRVERVEVERWRDREVRVAGPVRFVERRVETPGPAGPTVTVERVVERGPVTTVRDDEGTRATDTKAEEVRERVVEREAPRWLLAATVGTSLSAGQLTPPAWGALLGWRFAGPFTAVVQGEVSAVGGSARVGLGIPF